MPALVEILLPNPKAAEAALQAIGAEWDPRFDLETDISGFGKIARRFGVLRNPLGAPPAADRRILDKFEAALAQPENAPLRERFATLKYCPVNKAIVQQLTEGLLSRKVHLPFTFRPMMLDLAAKIVKAQDAGNLPYDAFYAQGVQVAASGAAAAAKSAPPSVAPAAKAGDRRSLISSPTRPEAPPTAEGPFLTPGKLFSIPIRGSSDMTRMEPNLDHELDAGVALLLEVDARVVG